MNEFELTGRARTHVVELQNPSCVLHYEVAASVQAMQEAARIDGIDLAVVSGFRDFDTQMRIWNQKWSGERVLLDGNSQPLDSRSLTDAQRLDAILRWSAIPGGSRHHWGSDIDVVDRAAVSADYKVQLVPQEYAADGVFSRLSLWLQTHMSRFGFFRPYQNDKGGVAPEPWHLSYAPVSLPAAEALSLAMLRQTLQDSSMSGKVHVLARLPEIYTRFLLAIDQN